MPVAVSGQCFSSSGNPVGGSGNMGCLDKNTLSIMGFYRHSVSDRFYQGSKRSEVELIRNANYNFLGTLFAYGLTNKLTLETELGYFINKTKNYSNPADYSLTGYGLTNSLVSGKYQIYYNPVKKIEYSASLGLKIPFSLNSQTVDNVRLPFDLQPSTSTMGAVFQSYLIKERSYTGMRYFLYNRVEINGTNRDGYRYGNVFINSIFVSKHLIRTSNWPVSGTLILQLRNETRGRSFVSETVEPASGSVKFFLAPQVNFALHDKWYFSVMMDVPVYQYYQYIQLADRLAFTVVLIKPIPLSGS
jgi:hypothetical protein